MNTKIASFAAVALTAALVSENVHLTPSFAQVFAQVVTLDRGDNDIATISASRKTRCIMPKALRMSCDL